MCYMALRLKDGPLTVAGLAQRRTNVLKQVYATLEGSTQPCTHHEELQHVLNEPESFDYLTEDKFENFLSSTIFKEIDMKEGVTQRL